MNVLRVIFAVFRLLIITFNESSFALGTTIARNSFLGQHDMATPLPVVLESMAFNKSHEFLAPDNGQFVAHYA